MDHAGHIFMDQANQFVVTGSGKDQIECLSTDHRWSGDARRWINRRTTGRKSRTSDKKIRANLSGYQKCDGVDVVSLIGPSNVVPGVNPDFVRKKSQRLRSL